MSQSAHAGWSYWQPRFSSAQAVATPYPPQMTPQQEMEILKDEQQFIKNRLGQIDARLQELEKEK